MLRMLLGHMTGSRTKSSRAACRGQFKALIQFHGLPINLCIFCREITHDIAKGATTHDPVVGFLAPLTPFKSHKLILCGFPCSLDTVQVAQIDLCL
jgi:hypothetical protein